MATIGRYRTTTKHNEREKCADFLQCPLPRWFCLCGELPFWNASLKSINIPTHILRRAIDLTAPGIRYQSATATTITTTTTKRRAWLILWCAQRSTTSTPCCGLVLVAFIHIREDHFISTMTTYDCLSYSETKTELFGWIYHIHKKTVVITKLNTCILYEIHCI